MEAASHSNQLGQHTTTSDTRKEAERLGSKLLEPIAKQILEHTKQLGLFDEMRVRLLDCIETSRDFGKLRHQFQAQMENFCNQVDLSLPRAKLREHLTRHLLQQTSQKLRDLVRSETSSKKHRHEIRRLYNKRALNYIEANILEKEEPTPADCQHHQDNSTTHTTDTTAQQHSGERGQPSGQEEEKEEEQEELPEPDTMPLSTGSSHSSTTTTDSGFSSLLAASTSPPSPPTPPPPPPPEDEDTPLNQELTTGASIEPVTTKKIAGYHIPKIKRDLPQELAKQETSSFGAGTIESLGDNQKESSPREASDKEGLRGEAPRMIQKRKKKKKKNKRGKAHGRWSHRFQIGRRRSQERFSRRRDESSSSGGGGTSSTTSHDGNSRRRAGERATSSHRGARREDCGSSRSIGLADLDRKKPLKRCDTSPAPQSEFNTTTTANKVNKHN